MIRNKESPVLTTVTIWLQVLHEHRTCLRAFQPLAARPAGFAGKAGILARLRRAELGNFGDCKPVGEGVSEMRIAVGQGYRVYFMQEGRCLYLLLVGGNKSSQTRDTAKAKALAQERRQGR